MQQHKDKIRVNCQKWRNMPSAPSWNCPRMESCERSTATGSMPPDLRRRMHVRRSSFSSAGRWCGLVECIGYLQEQRSCVYVCRNSRDASWFWRRSSDLGVSWTSNEPSPIRFTLWSMSVTPASLFHFSVLQFQRPPPSPRSHHTRASFAFFWLLRYLTGT